MKKIKTKKRSKIIILTAAILFTAVSVLSVNAEGWYCMRAGHDVPSLPAEFIYLEEYGGRYIDRNADEQNKVIYLTFDAGYENGNVEKILDTLCECNVKGAFFVLENLILREPELIKRMQREGHIVANHTATHRDMTTVSTIDEFAAELSRLEEVYKSTVGCEMPKIYRPPEGKLTKKSLEFANELGYKTVMWSFAYADWDNNKQPDPEESVKRILDNTHNGMIILLHPTSATNAAIIGRLIDEWSAMGYRFGTLDELA
ncbi:MAG: polysaccharide deacetylase family protein [Clostridia bacterium]|nr:polysaccharide deacetylase family protein [Clostridia bacterium]